MLTCKVFSASAPFDSLKSVNEQYYIGQTGPKRVGIERMTREEVEDRILLIRICLVPIGLVAFFVARKVQAIGHQLSPSSAWARMTIKWSSILLWAISYALILQIFMPALNT